MRRILSIILAFIVELLAFFVILQIANEFIVYLDL